MKPTPMIYQNERNECGLACIAMVLCSFNKKVDLIYLRKKIGNRELGVSLEDLLRVADDEDLNTRPIKIDLEDLENIKKPAILHWEMDHYVVLTKAKNGKYTIHDPNKGKLVVNQKTMDESFTGVAVEFYKRDNFFEGDFKTPISLLMLWTRAEGLIKIGLAITFFSLLLYALTFIVPVLMQLAIDFLGNKDNNILKTVCLSFVAIIISLSLIQLVRSWLLISLGKQFKFQLGRNVVSHLFSLSPKYFESRSVGEITARMDSLDVIRREITEGTLETIIDIGMVITSFSLMLHYSIDLSIWGFLTFIIIAILRIGIFYPKKLLTSKEIMISGSSEVSSLIESLHNMKAIKFAQAEIKRRSIWLNIFSKTITHESRLEKLSVIEETLCSFTQNILYVISVYLIVLLFKEGSFSVGSAIIYMTFQSVFISQSEKTINSLQSILILKAHIERMGDILQAKPEEKNVDNLDVKGKIEFKNVFFKYKNDEKWLLKNINLTINQGEHIAISGKSGAGKTTIIKLLQGEEEVCKGEILIDGKNFQGIPLATKRNAIVSVFQGDLTILEGTIEENITFFDNRPDEKIVKDVCKKAKILEKINELPLGLKSKIGAITVLSGGEIQRLIIARALYRQPKVLLLDEATSSLDKKTEGEIYEELYKIKATIISVSHREETLAFADNIYSLESGYLNKVNTRKN